MSFGESVSDQGSQQLWLFREFVSEIGKRRCITEWCRKELEVAGRVKFRQMLKELAVTPRLGWKMPH